MSNVSGQEALSSFRCKISCFSPKYLMCALRKCALELENLNSTLTHCLRREMWPSLKSPTLHQTVLLKTWKELKSDKCNCVVIVLQIILSWLFFQQIDQLKKPRTSWWTREKLLKFYKLEFSSSKFQAQH